MSIPKFACSVGVIAIVACDVIAQGQLPPTYRLPRQPVAWKAELARLEALPNLDELFPERWTMMRQRWNTFTMHDTYDAATAEALVSELYVDHGEPSVNQANQNYLVTFISMISERSPPDRLPASSRAIISDGLLAFRAAGGGAAYPSGQARLALALDYLAPNDPAVQKIVEDLLNDAAAWVERVDAPSVTKDAVYRRAAMHWGDAYWLDVYERSAQLELPANQPKRYKDALQLLRAVLSKDGRDQRDGRRLLRTLREATDAVFAGCGQAVFDDDLTARLLVVWRIVLRRKPGIPDDAARYVDGHLLRLARGTERLRRELHWDLWGQAVSTLRLKRMSSALQSYARRLRLEADAKKLEPPQTKAAAHLLFLAG